LTLVADYSRATLAHGWWEAGADRPALRGGAAAAEEGDSSGSEDEGLAGRFWSAMAI
jgi:hypothetical protein